MLDIAKDAMTIWMINRDQHYFKICNLLFWNPLLIAHLKIICKVHLETLQTFSTTHQSSPKKRSIRILYYQWTWTLHITSLNCQKLIFQFLTNQISKSTAIATTFFSPTNLFSKLIKSKLKSSHQYCQQFGNSKSRKMDKSIPHLSQVSKKRTSCLTTKSKIYKSKRSSKTLSGKSRYSIQIIFYNFYWLLALLLSLIFILSLLYSWYLISVIDFLIFDFLFVSV